MIIHKDELACGEVLNYAEGLLEPNFPVPAVRYEWDWIQELAPNAGTIHLALKMYGVYYEWRE